MGQSALCQTTLIQDVHGGKCAGLTEQTCSCLPSRSAAVQEHLVDAGGASGEIGLAVDTFESDSSSATSDVGECGQPLGKPSSTSSHLVLTRHRVFSPHLHSKFHEYYKLERMLGEGSYGNVYEAVVLPGTAPDARGRGGGKKEPWAQEGMPRRVAAKCFALTARQAREGEDPEQPIRELWSRRSSFERERAILARLEHPHIIKMYECFEDKDHLWIVLELCLGGELYERIADRVYAGHNGGLEESVGRTFFRQMLHACGYLHASRVVHRDVKTENFLVLGVPGSADGAVIKLCDFGTAVQLSNEQPRAMERIGTLSYTAPEVYAKKGATILADAWSLGVVLYVLLVGASPFRITGEEPRDETVRRIQVGDYDMTRSAWHNLSAESQDLIRRFLIIEETHRLTSAQALRHPWVEPGASTVLERNSSTPMSPRRYLSPRSLQEEDIIVYAAYGRVLLQLFMRFACLDAMQQLALVVCAQMTPEAELIHIREPLPWYDLFFVLDANEDGRLDFAELVSGIRRLLGPAAGISDEQLGGLVRALDLDCSGAVDWVEWAAVALLTSDGLGSQPEPLRTAFRLLDRPSGDGSIGAADLLAVLNSGATGSSLSTVHGREQAHQLLGLWARAAEPRQQVATAPALVSAAPALPPALPMGEGRREGRRRRKRSFFTNVVSPPSMALADLQRAIAAALMDSSLGGVGGGSGPFPWGGRKAGPAPGAWFPCCQSEKQPVSQQVLVWDTDAARHNRKLTSAHAAPAEQLPRVQGGLEPHDLASV